ncbi:biotin/lipoyl-binding protein [Paenibacillus sp. MWE-103]|uniref:Biotin/lipoyl-binding protein n=1 Tax=Paenibacillus artemisiicola TaxID=1172618 RepID=A0ABS3W997_9BACL|nr:biotin/lipoyl-binding protein [Paenibacillus artemisiicola]MBO7744876.1 biotin/lipoyl-binding protein [Paenibacillus artemisiicola]
MEERTSRSRKRKLRLAAGAFLVLLAACTLAGNTLRGLSLPKVATAVAANGSIPHDYEGSATVQPGQTRDIANPAGWKVKRVLVKEGDRVSRGQTLVEYDDGEAKQQLADMQAELKKLDLSMDQLHTNYILAANGGDESAKAAAKTAIESAELDVSTQQQHIQSLQKSIAEGRSAAAPFDGVVTRVGAIEGSGPGGEPDVVLANAAEGYEIRLLVPGDVAALLEPGETLDQITLTGKDERQLTGTIAALDDEAPEDASLPPADGASGGNAPAPPPSRVTVAIKDDGLKGGERVRVKIAKPGGKQTVTVPNEAVHHDARGAYVFTLRADEGPLGSAYYAVETPIKIADSNAYVTAVADGLFEQQEVVVNATGFLVDGTRVRR